MKRVLTVYATYHPFSSAGPSHSSHVASRIATKGNIIPLFLLQSLPSHRRPDRNYTSFSGLLLPVAMEGESVYSAFCDNSQKTMKPRPPNSNKSLSIRVVSPQESFVLENGQPVPLRITLGQVRQTIAQRLDTQLTVFMSPRRSKGHTIADSVKSSRAMD